MVATTRPTSPEPKLEPSPELLAALEEGTLTQDQLRELITIEAQQLGLTFQTAVKRARDDTLPRTTLGFDLRLLVSMLAA
ncbi:MAG: hypothetical protein DCC58_17630 [Chloroflexi bacterium]|nr:MAG: hypothetical protein DCC58_17630 [Chloroflexota bacterium]